MKFKDAKKLLREGKKIRRPCWKKNSYWYLEKDETIYYSDCKKKERAHVHLEQLEADDWEENILMSEQKIDLIFIQNIKDKVDNYEGSFMWAIEQMRKGKKVRRKIWNQQLFWNIPYLYSFCKNVESSIDNPNFTLDNFEATDWEIFEEKYLQFCVQCKNEFKTDESLAEEWKTLRCDKCLNKFGVYEVTESGHIMNTDTKEIVGLKDKYEDLEKAIKRARELQ